MPSWDVGRGVTKEDYDAGRTPGGSTFETYRGNKNIGTDLKLQAKFGNPEQQKIAREQLAKNKTYGTSANQSVFEKMGTKTRNYNINQRNKYIQRILKARMNKMQSGFMDSTIPGIDTMTMEELINLAPSITAYGPEYHQNFLVK